VFPILGNAPLKGVVHFIGGAFAGATPDIFYQTIVQRLRESGFVVISTPYALTFRHADCARSLSYAFRSALVGLDLPKGTPVYGVGHSGGSLLHLLISSLPGLPLQQGCLIEPRSSVTKSKITISSDNNNSNPTGSSIRSSGTDDDGGQPGAGDEMTGGSSSSGSGECYDALVLMCTNNFSVNEAIPIPGLLDALPEVVNMVKPALDGLVGNGQQGGRGRGGGGTAASLVREMMDSQLALFPTPLADSIRSVQPLLDQLPIVLDEVASGYNDFVPSPEASRNIIREYFGTRRVLLVKFSVDETDESLDFYQLLQSRRDIDVELVQIGGTHLTPTTPTILVPWERGTAGVWDDVAEALHGLNTQEADQAAGIITGYLSDTS